MSKKKDKDPWAWMIKQFGPEVKAAWERDVGLPKEDFEMGCSGSKKPNLKAGEVPFRGSAVRKGWWDLPLEQRELYRYDWKEKTWTRVKFEK